jgi:hypothetical protein
MEHWNHFFKGLDLLRDKGMAIVVLAHNEVKSYNPPDGESYDKYVIKLQKQAASKLEEWADVLLFAGFRVTVNSDNGKVVNHSDRIIHATNKPAWAVKTRYQLPDELDMKFSSLISAIKENK